MSEALREAVDRFTSAYPGAGELTATAIPGLTLVRAAAPSGLVHAINRPLVCLVLQGSKHVTTGNQAFTFSGGASLLITADVPTVSQITEASAERPYLSLVLELDSAVLAELLAQVDGTPPPGPVHSVAVDPTETEAADTALRLMRLLDRPASIGVLQAQLVRELHYWLMLGRHGPAMRALGWPGGHAEHVARAVAVLRTEYAQPLSIARLAAVAGMSPSSFHLHFRGVTSLSPIQFQKQLRLIEARRLMLAEGFGAGRAAYAVGYESVPQFTREYGRMFGQSPAREIRQARVQIGFAA
ncbi:AraC family transcriptional regulator [Methylobacterium brachiatum]|jgi:AraC-like DNA-binding protein|uniref:AraC family transcriptional regulator n=2 Tax=Methylobacterium TaxID=407 RepID=A0AAJ1WZ19_9HYPH|nr:AraC family transcriptional regulator [Methylobacterium brachiatum]MCB4805850.1 AraC family transcriptional regulator [Methylobacterium brachiatum]MDF2600768.1 araC [Methylobacterium brachiatum]MDQ0547122.1 AraC-like DNA-binding protein [Methylobacterium brachiatum]